jgi:hypothetical protein
LVPLLSEHRDFSQLLHLHHPHLVGCQKEFLLDPSGGGLGHTSILSPWRRFSLLNLPGPCGCHVLPHRRYLLRLGCHHTGLYSLAVFCPGFLLLSSALCIPIMVGFVIILKILRWKQKLPIFSSVVSAISISQNMSVVSCQYFSYYYPHECFICFVYYFVSHPVYQVGPSCCGCHRYSP